MSFVLSGNARSLRFGEGDANERDSAAKPSARDLGPESSLEDGRVALGKPRVRRPTPAPSKPRPSLRRPLYGGPVEALEPIEPISLETSRRPHLEIPPPSSYGDLDDHPTMALDREGDARTMAGPRRLAIPGFRRDPSPDMPTVALRRDAAPPSSAMGMSLRSLLASPYTIWIVTSLALAVASFFATPAMIARL